MRKLKEVLRLHSLGLSQHQIARSCSISQSTVHEYVSVAQAAGVRWPLPDNWDDNSSSRRCSRSVPLPRFGENIRSRIGPKSTKTCRCTRT